MRLSCGDGADIGATGGARLAGAAPCDMPDDGLRIGVAAVLNLSASILMVCSPVKASFVDMGRG